MLLMAACACLPLAAHELPSALNIEQPGLSLHSSADLRRFGFKIYTARLWTSGAGFSANAPYALDIEYALSVDAAQLVETSIAEMRGQGHRDEALLARWAQDMAAVFPDVHRGDRLIALARPGIEARFYSAQGYLASIRDATFVDAFFGIWLADNTRAPQLRAALLAPRREAP